MNLRHLYIFKIVCEEENITKAALRLYMSQPAVSNAILELENHLGINLFDRISRKIYLNETGKLFLSKAIKLLDLYEDLENTAKELEFHTPIKIGSSITIGNFTLPKVIKDFNSIYKDIKVNIVIENALNIENKILNNEIDLALIEGIINNEQLIAIPFSYHKLVVICSLNHKFSTMDSVSTEDLTKEPLLLREKGSSIRDAFDSALLLNNLSVTPEWTSVNSQALIHAVKENIGVSILPRVLVEKYLSNNEIALVDVDGLNLKTKNNIVFHKNKINTKPVDVLIDIIKSIEI